jgi:hypothetical protein
MTAHLGKTAVHKQTASLGTLVSYPEVVAALQTDLARSIALGAYRSAGYTARDFALRRSARVAMTEALTATEDALELRGVRREREAIRAVRRRLECEVSP